VLKIPKNALDKQIREGRDRDRPREDCFARCEVKGAGCFQSLYRSNGLEKRCLNSPAGQSNHQYNYHDVSEWHQPTVAGVLAECRLGGVLRPDAPFFRKPS